MVYSRISLIFALNNILFVDCNMARMNNIAPFNISSLMEVVADCRVCCSRGLFPTNPRRIGVTGESSSPLYR